MRIAIPVWEDKVSPVFDAASKLLVIDYEDGRETSRLAYHIDEEDLSWKCQRIESLAPDIIICGAVSHLFLNLLKAVDIDVIEYVSGRIEDVLEAYIRGDIYNSRFLMPGCKRHGRVCGGRKKTGRQKKNEINREDI
ncbi:MAG: NifB/NifX family molybdenum-iron cluster-binding protein [Deltaproteobacteria bacterium]|nr:NifB/NifX family molybdenum-iron cluster-binding protein [Deltaproteobacteria bacterium]